MARKKKLDINNLLKDDKLFSKEKPVKIDNKTTLYMARKFDYSKIDELILELAQTVKFAKENNLDFPSTDEQMIQYTDFLIFKHFTNLQEALGDADYYMNIEAYMKSYQKGWMMKVMDKFDHEEVGKVYDKLYKVIENGDKIMREEKKLLNIIQSETLRKKLEKGEFGGKEIPNS